MNDSIFRVVKFGGSLLELPDLRSRLLRWLELQPSAVNLIVVGGGGLIDAMRQLDSVHSLDSRWIHWECIRLLRTTFRLMARIVPELVPLETPDALSEFVKAGEESHAPPAAGLVACDAFYCEPTYCTGVNDYLPESWATTTDALAAWLAERTNADELVLLKSAAVPADLRSSDYQVWADAGLVDIAFPAIARQLPVVRLVEFRNFQAD